MSNHGMGGNRRARVRRALLRRDGGLCAGCGRPFGPDLPPTIEHRIPWSQGGDNGRANLELLCHPCNQARSRSGLVATCT